MRTLNRTIVLVIVTAFVMNVFANRPRRAQTKPSGESAELTKKISRFAPTTLMANRPPLELNDTKALQKIIAAAKLFDPLYRRQIWSGNDPLLQKLESDMTPLGRLRLHYFKINQGPWSQLDDNE